MSLDLSSDDFRRALAEASEAVVRLYDGLPDASVWNGHDAAAISDAFDEALPKAPTDLATLIARVERELFSTATLNISPRFQAYVMSGGTHAGIVAELLAAAINQNGGKWHLGPSQTEISHTVVRWLGEFLGYPAGGGAFVTGGSDANLHGLAAARAAKAPFDVREEGVRAGPPLTLYVSAEAHSSLDKSVEMLGLGRRHLRKIAVRDDLTIDLHALTDQIDRDVASGCHPIAVIGNAGTINNGTVDPLDELAEVCEQRGLWFHVDGAYGALAAATDLAAPMFRGMERADSVAIDPHKWLYVPFEAGCVLVRDPATLRRAFSLVPDYLRTPGTERYDPMEYGFQLSRSFRALKVWLTFLAYGADALREAIEDNIRVMRHLGELIEASDDFELLAPVPLSAVCFRYHPKGVDDPEALDGLNTRLPVAIEQDGRYFVVGTRIRGAPCLRACSVNHRLERSHVEGMLEVVRELGGALAGQ